MAKITLGGSPINTIGELPAKNSVPQDVALATMDLSDKKISDFRGKKVVLNIFPSIDTGVCAASARRFNVEAASLENTVVINVSKDLPFALNRFCAAEGIENVETLSDFRSDFGEIFGVTIADSPMRGLLSRSVVILDEAGKVIYTEQVPEIKQEPDYAAALKAIKN